MLPPEVAVVLIILLAGTVTRVGGIVNVVKEISLP
jgi:hypothetical protein